MDFSGKDRKLVFITLAFAALIIIVYTPLLGSDFINYDDPSYVTANSHVKEGLSIDSIGWAFSTFYFYNWHPLTWVSHMLDVQLFGLNPTWHHLVNLLFHITNSVLLFFLFRSMSGSLWKSLGVAALFALHPLHVQSVAWVSERKDVLSAFFWFVTMLSYAWYARKPGRGRYVLCIFLFCCGLMAKPMLITLPFVLLCMDYWPLGRLEWGQKRAKAGDGFVIGKPASLLLLEKVPMAVLAIASSVVTFLAQKRGGAIHDDNALSADMANGVANYLRYPLKMLWPDRLAVYYPYDPAAISPWLIVISLLFLIIISVMVIIFARRRPYLPVGWLWYLVTFLPVIGFLRIGEQAMADRYTYIPLIGLFVIIVWGTADLAERLNISGTAVGAAFITVLTGCSILANLQARTWKDSVTLFSHAVAVTDNNWIAHKNLAAALARQGNFTEALQHVSESLRIRPEPLEYVSQGWLYLQLGDFAKAVESCDNALKMAPDNVKAHFIRGTALSLMGDFQTATAEYDILNKANSSYAPQLLNQLRSAGSMRR